MIICMPSGKDSYESKAEVRRRAKFSRGQNVSIYRCAHCERWHFGRSKPLDTRIKIKGRLNG